MNRNGAQNFRQRKSERGSVLAASAIGMLSLLLAVGLAVDVSRFYLVKTELQNAADASALAAASALNSLPTGIIEARKRAINEIVNNYDFNHKQVTLNADNLRYGVNLSDLDGTGGMTESQATASPANIRFVKVTIPPEAVGVSFAQMVLGSSKNIAAEAVAGMSVPPNIFCNWLPLAVITSDDGMALQEGNTYVIRSSPGGGPSPGNYQILAVDGSGGQDVETGTGGGVHFCKHPGDTYPVDTKPGITAGKVRKGINARFDDYTGSQLDPAIYPPDNNVMENISYTDYYTNIKPPTHAGVDGRRLVILPLVKQSEFDQGRNVVKFFRFGLFFLKTKVDGGNGGAFEAEFRKETIVMGGVGFDPSGGLAATDMAAPVLYR